MITGFSTWSGNVQSLISLKTVALIAHGNLYYFLEFK